MVLKMKQIHNKQRCDYCKSLYWIKHSCRKKKRFLDKVIKIINESNKGEVIIWDESDNIIKNVDNLTFDEVHKINATTKGNVLLLMTNKYLRKRG